MLQRISTMADRSEISMQREFDVAWRSESKVLFLWSVFRMFLGYQTFAMTGALAWQVTDSNKKNIICLRGDRTGILPGFSPLVCRVLLFFLLISSYSLLRTQMGIRIINSVSKGRHYQTHFVQLTWKYANSSSHSISSSFYNIHYLLYLNFYIVSFS